VESFASICKITIPFSVYNFARERRLAGFEISGFNATSIICRCFGEKSRRTVAFAFTLNTSFDMMLKKKKLVDGPRNGRV